MTRNHTEDPAIEKRPSRAPFGWFPRLGMNLLLFFADGPGGYAPAPDAGPCGTGFSGGGTITDMKCCGLARPDKECCYPTGGSKALFKCPPPYQKTWWFCMVGRQPYGCGECASGSSCYQGPFECSILWEVVPC